MGCCEHDGLAAVGSGGLPYTKHSGDGCCKKQPERDVCFYVR